MGSGKTYWGRIIAKKKQLNFIDLDIEIEQRIGMSIAEIFETKGEDFFREIETEILLTIISTNSKVIIATGGGTACFNNNMNLMNESGITIWLNDSPDKIVERIKPFKEVRPLLKNIPNNELHSYIKNLINSRKHFYAQCKYQLDESKISELELLQIIN